MDSSGCGSSTIWPSGVRFTWGAGAREDDLDRGYVGKEEEDVRAGCCLRPRGSFRSAARSRIVPEFQIKHG